jgi:two-component system, OmpR family, sensor kinase
MSAAGEKGVAFVCDGDGLVLDVLCDELGVGVAPGRSLPDVVEPASAEKARSFLAVLRAQGAAFNWELNVPTEARAATRLHFAGGAVSSGFLVVGATSRAGVAHCYEARAREGASVLHEAFADMLNRSRAEQVERDEAHYDELSRLNNDLATAQRELAKKNVELARLNDQKNQFLGIAAHDLRNPLQVQLAFSQFLLDELAATATPQQIHFVRTIRSSSAFMLDLVNDLLDISKIEAGRLDLEPTLTDLVALVEANVALNRILAQPKGIAIDVPHAPDRIDVSVDPPKIEQVLNNLVGNAVKFAPPGSTVVVRIAREGAAAVISVHNDGEGIPAEDVERIFNPFERGHSKAAWRERGTGLGLAIVKKIVDAHEGEIRVESGPDEGVTVHVALPVALGAAPVASHVEGGSDTR